MNNRLKMFGLIALCGFVAGVLAQVTATFIIPWIVEIAPMLSSVTSFFVAGCAGAVITVALVGAWAYLTGRKDTY